LCWVQDIRWQVQAAGAGARAQALESSLHSCGLLHVGMRRRHRYQQYKLAAHGASVVAMMSAHVQGEVTAGFTRCWWRGGIVALPCLCLWGCGDTPGNPGVAATKGEFEQRHAAGVGWQGDGGREKGWGV